MRTIPPHIAQCLRRETPRRPLGPAALDAHLQGGIATDALHDMLAATPDDLAAAIAFTAGTAARLAGARPILWVRQDAAEQLSGALHAPGLAALGLDPARILLVRARDAPAVLRAGLDAARSGALGAVLIEPWGESRHLDMTATRRLALAASTTPVLLLRAGAPMPSAAATRWRIRAAPSRPRLARAPGAVLHVELLRHRQGIPGRAWLLEWDDEQREFRTAQDAGDAFSASRGRAPVARAG